MSIRLFIAVYTDEHITTRLAKVLRERGYDAISANEAGMAHQSDEQHLAYAARHGFALMTRDMRHFPNLDRQYHAEGRRHGGIIIVPREMKFGELLRRRTLVLLDKVTADEAANRMLWLSNYG